MNTWVDFILHPSAFILFCVLLGLPGCGRSSISVYPGCTADEDCPPGRRCVDGECRAGCRTREDCELNEIACAGGACDPFCTAAICDRESGVCFAAPRNEGQACDDVDACTAGDRCLSGACIPAGELDCDDGNGCTVDRCDVGIGCVHELKDCDDGLDCTYDGCLVDYGCAHVPAEGFVVVDGECLAEGENDPGPCREERDGVIVDLPDGTPCEDSSLCTLDTHCREGVCGGGRPLQCPDGDPVTTDTCSPLSGCLHDTACDEFQVNVVSEGRQGLVRTISFPEGGGVAVWQTTDSSSDVLRISFRLFHAGGSPGDEIEVLPLTEVEQVYGAWAGLGMVARVDDDRFAISWNLGMQGQGIYRIYDRHGSPVTDELVLPDPLLPEPLEEGEVLLSYRYLAHEPQGFFVLMYNHTSPGGSNEALYLYRFDRDGRLQMGPVDVELLGDDYGRAILAAQDGTFQIFFSNYRELLVRTFDSATLLPLGDAMTIDTVSPYPHTISEVRRTPWGPVVAACNHHGSWLLWLEPDGSLASTTTLATVTGGTAGLEAGLAVWNDGRIFAAVTDNSQPNGMALHRFTEHDEQISGVFSLDCAGRNHNPKPRLIRLDDARALVVWDSFVTDGEYGSIRGRYLSW